MLTSVEQFLVDYYSNDQSGSAMEGTLASGCEIWLRDVGTANGGLMLEMWWVDHQLRTVVIGGDENEHARKGSRNDKVKKGGGEEDRKFCFSYCFAYNVTEMCSYLLELDGAEYRYWSFMEAYPAHNSLPAKAKMEALDVLMWAWTGNNGFIYSLALLG